MKYFEPPDNEEVLAGYGDFLSQNQGLLFGADVLEQWNTAARKFAEFIAPLPLIEATAQEAKEFHWKVARGPRQVTALTS